MSFANRLLVSGLPLLPEALLKSLARPYIAGSSIDDAVTVIGMLNSTGTTATVDVLGEQFESAAQIDQLVKQYRDVLAAIATRTLDANLSVKMTGLGLKLSFDMCLTNLRALTAAAAELGNFIRIDMEDSTTTAWTLDAYRSLRSEGIDNVGIVLQAYLRRTLADIRELASLRPSVRLVKGIWQESPAVALQDRDAIRISLSRCLDALLSNGARVAIASHDEWVHCETLRLVDKHGLKRDDYEFEMLLGVQEQLAQALLADGHRLRIYVPFGDQWREYCLRRLQENPLIASYIARDTLERLTRRSGTHDSADRTGAADGSVTVR
jgi:proline dehydrogenase